MTSYTVIITWALAASAGTGQTTVCFEAASPDPAKAAVEAWRTPVTHSGSAVIEWMPETAVIASVRAVADGCGKHARPSIAKPPEATILEIPAATYPATVHYRTPDGSTARCNATILCSGRGDHCEAVIDPGACTSHWGLEQCLASTVAVPGDDSADTLGCDPGARLLDIDWTD